MPFDNVNMLANDIGICYVDTFPLLIRFRICDLGSSQRSFQGHFKVMGQNQLKIRDYLKNNIWRHCDNVQVNHIM